MSTDRNPLSRAENDVTLKSELREAHLEIRALRAELARTAPDIDDLKRQLVAARKQGDRYREQVEALRRSSSWRITKPLRRLRRRRG
ncbi:hypothetical protein GCM10022381_16340 [Leifsonia kafniensis]|uniref:DUF3618 domain-containing protein n=1 Tax=Leifsonia kafniensis TaxID=475957 RepID=A0ABP7KDZ6_9MICO